MRNFIKNTGLLLIVFNLFSFASYAELEAGNNFDVGNSTAIIVPVTDDEKEEENKTPPTDNNSGNTGGGSYKPTAKPSDKPETQEPIPTETNTNPFADIKQDDWYYNDVMFVSDKKIMTGTGENEFSPHTTLNRAMMITILYRISGDTSVYEKDIFNDVEKNSWYENAVNWGYANKIVSGTSGNTFAPMDNLTREQLCVMLYNYTKHIGVKPEFAVLSSFADNETVSSWAKDAVSWAVHEKIITGKGNNTLAPGDSATRAEAAAVIRRYTEKFTGIEEK